MQVSGSAHWKSVLGEEPLTAPCSSPRLCLPREDAPGSDVEGLGCGALPEFPGSPAGEWGSTLASSQPGWAPPALYLLPCLLSLTEASPEANHPAMHC